MTADYSQIAAVQQLAREGQLDRALRKLRELILQNDDDINMWHLYAELAVDSDDLRFALENILRLNPRDQRARARLRGLEGETLPDYVLSLPVKAGEQGGENPTAYLSHDMLEKLGVQPGDFLRLSNKRGVTLPVIAESGGTRGSITLNAQAHRLLDVREDVAVIPPETLILAMDVSASMGTRLSRLRSRLAATKKAIHLLLDAKQREADDRVGLITFETRSRILVQPTQAYDEVRGAADRMHLGGATAMNEALSQALMLLRGVGGMKRIILLTDGVPTTSTPEAVLKTAQQARRESVVIDTIGLGKPGHREYHEGLLRSIAEITGGRFRYVDDLETLQETFEVLALEKRLLLKD